jgi:amino acid permease
MYRPPRQEVGVFGRVLFPIGMTSETPVTKRRSVVSSIPASFTILLQQLPRGGGVDRTIQQHHQLMKQPQSQLSSSSSPSSSSFSSSSSSNELEPPDGTVDPVAHIINLIKTIIGAGVLGIPAGMTASFATSSRTSSTTTNILGRCLILLILIGLLAANGFNHIGQICRCTNSVSYAQAWNRTVSESTTILPNIACIMVTFCTLVTYSMVLSDTIPSLLRPLLEHTSWELMQRTVLPRVTRTNVLLVLTMVVLLPLCLLQSLSALAPFSFVGICGMVYTGVIMTIRYFDQSYASTGRFFATIEPKWYVHTHFIFLCIDFLSASVIFFKVHDLTDMVLEYENNSRPNFDMSLTTTSPTQNGSSGNAAILISMLSTAYMAHYNAPKFYWELSHRTSEKYTSVVYQSFMGAILLMVIISSMGFLTFGTNSQSLILNNYSTQDHLMSLSRWAVVLSLIFSYPLAFVGVRDGICNLFHIQQQTNTSETNRRTNQIVTVTILSIITLVAALMKDIRVILSLGGATFGNLLAYVFPAFMVVGLAHQKRMEATKQQRSSKHIIMDSFPTPNQERFAVLTAVVGVMMGILGTIKAIQSI